MVQVAETLGSVAANFRADMAEKIATFPLLSIRATAVCALYHGALMARRRSNERKGPTRFAPILRLLANSKSMCGKSYIPADECGDDVELTANLLPAYCRETQARWFNTWRLFNISPSEELECTNRETYTQKDIHKQKEADCTNRRRYTQKDIHRKN